jgi:two-component system chemotaxis response regulator CheY
MRASGEFSALWSLGESYGSVVAMVGDNDSTRVYRAEFGRLQVLIVDDVALMRNILKTTLRGFGFDRFDDASTGEEAVMRCRSVRYDLIFLDIDMPEKSGLEALSEIRTYNRDAFVVMVSAHSSAANVKHAIKLGADGFIVKPYAAKKVAQLIAKYDKGRESEDSGMRPA